MIQSFAFQKLWSKILKVCFGGSVLSSFKSEVRPGFFIRIFVCFESISVVFHAKLLLSLSFTLDNRFTIPGLG
jgi:hypothetical protein